MSSDMFPEQQIFPVLPQALEDWLKEHPDTLFQVRWTIDSDGRLQFFISLPENTKADDASPTTVAKLLQELVDTIISQRHMGREDIIRGMSTATEYDLESLKYTISPSSTRVLVKPTSVERFLAYAQRHNTDGSLDEWKTLFEAAVQKEWEEAQKK